MKVGIEPESRLLLRALGIKPGAAEVSLQSEVPEEVSEAVHSIATRSQHGFIHTWLPDLVEKNIRPKVSSQEDEARIDRILKFRDQCVTVIPAKGNAPEVSPPKINDRIEQLKGRYADCALQYLAYHRSTEKVKGIFKAALLATAAGFLLTHFAPAFVQTAEAMGDDVANWLAQVMTMRSQGISNKEIAQSQIFPAAGLVGVQQLTHDMNGAIAQGGSCKAMLGFQYGFAASLLSLAAIPSGIFVLAKHYLSLAREGKVRPPEYGGKFKKIRLVLHAIKEAAKENWKYPAVSGVVLGSVAAMAAGALLGPLAIPISTGILLQNPIFLAVAGTGPSFGALLVSSLQHKSWNRKFNKVLRKMAAEESS